MADSAICAAHVPHVSPLLLPAGSLIDKKGKILIPGINEAVDPVTSEEQELYDHIDFDLDEFAKDVGAKTLLHDSKVLAGAMCAMSEPPHGGAWYRPCAPPTCGTDCTGSGMGGAGL